MRGGGLLRLILAGTAALVMVAAAAVAFLWIAWAAPGPTSKEADVVLPKGSSVAEISSALARDHVIRSAFLFRQFAKLTGADRTLRAGEYDFPAHASLAQVLKMMASGQIVRHWITVPEGRTSGQVAAMLAASPILTGAVTPPPEGALLPQTYEVARGDDREQVLQAMRDARDKVVDQLWAARAPGLPFKTPEQAVIMASIVEKETAVPAERAHVAAVYENRLVKGMKLQADPSVIYGVSKGEPLGRGLRMSELTSSNPYNTYANVGLPPTPIANPGRASLEAVLHPMKSDDLYFVADGSGGHVFTTTFEAHAKNVANWRKVEAAQRRPTQGRR